MFCPGPRRTACCSAWVRGGYEGDALADTQALADTLSEVGFPCHLEVWGGDVSHDWYWWGKEFGMFAERLFG